MTISLQLLICIVFLFVIVIWFYEKKYQHHINSMVGMMLAMSVGMMSGLIFGLIFGIIMNEHFFHATVFSMLIGMIIGAFIGSVISIIAALEGMLSGLMAGMMGAMLGVMVEGLYFEAITKILFIIFSAVILLVLYTVNQQLNKVETKKFNFIEKPVFVIVFMLVIFLFTFQLGPLYENTPENEPEHHHMH